MVYSQAMRCNNYTNQEFPKTQRVWRNPECMWISVPKNANMVMRKVCEHSAMNNKYVSLDNIPKSKEVFTIVRDPETRLLSALAECKNRSKNKQIKQATFTQLLKMLLDDISIFDEHLEPQLYYMQYHTFTHILRFDHLNTDIQNVKYFQSRQKVIDRHINPDLLSRSRKSGLKDMKKLLMENQPLVDACIKKYYQTDQNIYNNPENYINKPMQKLMPYE